MIPRIFYLAWENTYGGSHIMSPVSREPGHKADPSFDTQIYEVNTTTLEWNQHTRNGISIERRIYDT